MIVFRVGFATDIEAVINELQPGPYSPPMKMWHLYLPADVPSTLLGTPRIHLDFGREAARIGLEIGFNGSKHPHQWHDKVYAGPRCNLTFGPVFLSGNGKWRSDIDCLNDADNPPHALSDLSVANINPDRNTLCPCRDASFRCTRIHPDLPPLCLKRVSADDSEHDDDIVINLAVLVGLVTLVLLVRAGE